MLVVCIIEFIIIFMLLGMNAYLFEKSSISQIANDAIVKAEGSKERGEEKMKIAVEYIQENLSKFWKTIFTPDRIEKIVQFAFDQIKNIMKKGKKK